MPVACLSRCEIMEAEPDSRLKPCDVLVIDDDIDTLDLVITFLSKKGINAAGLSRTEDYLEAIGRIKPRVLLLDVNMPGFNGYDLCENIKASKILKKIAVYFLTAMPPSDVHNHVQSCGADGFIAKPFTLHELEKVVATVLRG